MAQGNQPLTPFELEVLRKRNRIAELETVYLRAKEYEKSDKFLTDHISALSKIRGVVSSGIRAQGDANFILGRIQQIILDTFEYERTIEEYEDLKAKMAEQFPQK